MINEITDTERLNWILNHPSYEFKHSEDGITLTYQLDETDSRTNGIPGVFVFRGITHRECIDAALNNHTVRIS